MKVLSTILALIVLLVGFNSAPAEADLAPPELSNPTETSALDLPPMHWFVFDNCRFCHVVPPPPVPIGTGRSRDLEQLFQSWADADRLMLGD